MNYPRTGTPIPITKHRGTLILTEPPILIKMALAQPALVIPICLYICYLRPQKTTF